MNCKSQSVIERKSTRKVNAPLYLGLAWGKSIDTGMGVKQKEGRGWHSEVAQSHPVLWCKQNLYLDI